MEAVVVTIWYFDLQLLVQSLQRRVLDTNLCDKVFQ